MSFSPEPRNANDDLDDLFDYDIDEADLQTLDISVPAPRSPPPATRTEKEDVLGLDAEVKVKKTRGPAVKLDEKRLLGHRGLPKLRKEAPKILKFKGKGHEYRDAEKLLSYYQHWADELFRKGKFRDTLSIIEKIGHSRTMKWEREGWMMECQRKAQGESEPTEEQQPPDDVPANGEEVNDDELYSVPKENAAPKPSMVPKQVEVQDPDALFMGAFDDSDEDMLGGPDDDEIEALMAMEAARKTLPVAGGPPVAQAEKGQASAPPKAVPPPMSTEDKDLEDEMDEMMSYMD